MSCGQSGAILSHVALRHVHQPLHAGYADDRGGNKFQVRVFGRGTNLHALWDTGLIQTGPGHGDLNAGLLSTPAQTSDMTQHILPKIRARS